MRWSRTGVGLAVVALCFALAVSGTAPEQQLTVYTSQTSYSLPALDRGGKSYVSVTDLLLPLGATKPILKGKEWKFALNKAEVRLTKGKEKATIGGKQVELGGKLLVENGRVMLPMVAVLPVLGRLLNTTVDYHQPARRLFVGNTFTRFTADFKNVEQP